MRRKFWIFLLLFAIFLFAGCEGKTIYRFNGERSEIIKIEVVQIGEDILNSDGFLVGQEIVPICEVTDITLFLKEFEEIDCTTIFTDPQGIEKGAISIKITYNDGSYELISQNGQALFVDNIYYAHKGRFFFNAEQFEAFISRYK